MPWSSLIAQDRVAAILQRTIASDRVAHAYLFHGPDGVGKRAMALEFASALLCERAADEACGKCLACTKVARLIHPDVHVLFPEPKDTPRDEVRERLTLLAKNPYEVVDFVRRPSLADPEKTSNKQVIYHVHRIHEDLHKPMSYRPVEGRYKVAIITDAHLLRTEAANAFLKLLEEPSSRTVFILVTSRPDRLLPTILSRCQQVRLTSLSDEAIADALIQRESIDPERAMVIARMSGGSYAEALELLGNEDIAAGRERILWFMRYTYQRDIEKLAPLLDEMAGEGRERAKSTLLLIQTWVRDLVRYRHTGSTDGITNVDQAKSIADFCKGLPQADLEGMVLVVEEAYGLAERNVNLPLLFTVLSGCLRRAMKGEAGVRLYIPLAEPSSEAA
jgi:DNA polymerase III subunit delta'